MNYREHISRGECLLNAVLWTVWAVLEIVLILKEYGSPYLDTRCLFVYVCTLIVVLAGCVLYWYRYLTYDKKTNKSDDI